MPENEGPFDPSEFKAPEVVEHLAEADDAEKAAIAAAELQRAKPRKTVLEAADADPNQRYDASGRALMPWEVLPKPREDVDA